MRKRCYLTEYRSSLGGVYGAWVWASSWSQAERLAKKRREKVYGRKLAERVVVLERPCSSVLTSRAPLIQKIHALCFLGLIACRSGAAKPDDFFDDEGGVLHQFVHWQASKRGDFGEEYLRPILKKVRAIERRVPGYLPPRVLKFRNPGEAKTIRSLVTHKRRRAA